MLHSFNVVQKINSDGFDVVDDYDDKFFFHWHDIRCASAAVSLLATSVTHISLPRFQLTRARISVVCTWQITALPTTTNSRVLTPASEDSATLTCYVTRFLATHVSCTAATTS